MKSLDLLKTPLAGRNLIEASAGTGKTYTITYLYLRLLLERQITVERILVVTYTEAATAELKERIRSGIRDCLMVFRGGATTDETMQQLVESFAERELAIKLLDRAMKRFDEAAIFTIHGFCQRMLMELAFESGTLFDAELSAEQDVLLQEIADDYVRLQLYEGLPGFVVENLSGCTVADFRLLSRIGLAADVVPQLERPQLTTDNLRPMKSRLVALWQGQRNELVTQLQEFAGFNRQSYNKSRVSQLVSDMDLFAVTDNLLPFDKFSLLTSSGAKLKKNSNLPDSLFWECADEYMQAAELLVEQIGELSIWLRAGFVNYLRDELPRRKDLAGILHFDDLLLRMRDALTAPAFVTALRARFEAALIDEFQDTDPVQYEVFNRVFVDCLFMIGDPKQAIYAFRGADIFTYLDAKESVAIERRYTLGINYRSAALLVAAVNRLFERNHDAFVFEGIDFEPVASGSGAQPLAGRAPMNIWLLDDELSREAATERIVQGLAAEIVELLTGEVEPGQIAVLVRSNLEARAVRDALAHKRVPCVLDSDENVFNSAEALDMLQLLSALTAPRSASMVRGALLSPLLGYSARDLDGLDDRGFDKLLELFFELSDLWQRQGFVRLSAALLSRFEVRQRILAQPLGERRLTNILQLIELLGSVSQQYRLDALELTKWLADRINAAASESEEHLMRLESDAQAVRIQTMHKSKGLEYDIVFCPFSWGASELRRGSLVSCHAAGRQLVDLGSENLDEHRALANREALAENMRLLYVALTRAKRCCYLVWGPIKGSATSAVAWLLHGHRVSDIAELPDFAELKADLAELADERIALLALPEASDRVYSPGQTVSHEPQLRSFGRSVDRSVGVTSFSALSYGASHVSDHDQLTLAGVRPEPRGDIFGFPRGARPGSMLHNIFENLDFCAGPDTRRQVVGESMRRFGFDELWLDVVDQMVGRVLAAPLGPEGIRLGRVALVDRLTELEFYCPLGLLEPGVLNGYFSELPETIRPGMLNFEPVQGYLRGFIDLVFRYEGRYYIVDWKSNHLGDRLSDYCGDNLERAMASHDYTVQYYIYAAALWRYLSLRGQQDSFGGVFYIFLRGVDPAAPGSGIYHDQPDLKQIELLAALLGGDHE